MQQIKSQISVTSCEISIECASIKRYLNIQITNLTSVKLKERDELSSSLHHCTLHSNNCILLKFDYAKIDLVAEKVHFLYVITCCILYEYVLFNKVLFNRVSRIPENLPPAPERRRISRSVGSTLGLQHSQWFVRRRGYFGQGTTPLRRD